jgi:hypothetical protein
MEKIIEKNAHEPEEKEEDRTALGRCESGPNIAPRDRKYSGHYLQTSEKQHSSI